MTPVDEVRLDQWIAKGDDKLVLEELAKLDPEAREALSPRAISWLEAVRSRDRGDSYGGFAPLDRSSASRGHLSNAVSTAVFATATAQVLLQNIEAIVDAAALDTTNALKRVVRKLRSTWAQSFTDACFERWVTGAQVGRFDGHMPWFLVCALVEGRQARPPTTGKISYGVAYAAFIFGGGDHRRDHPAALFEFADRIDAFVESEIWEIVDGKLGSYRNWGRPDGCLPVAEALRALIDEKRISRGRVLDACLQRALGRSFEQLLYLRVARALQPTAKELEPYRSGLMALLSSEESAVVTLTARWLRDIASKAELPIDEALENLGAIWRGDVPGQHRELLKILDALVVRHPERTLEVLSVAAEGLCQQRAQIRDSVLDLLEKHGTDVACDLEPLLLSFEEDLSPGQVGRLRSWLGIASPDPQATVNDELLESAGHIPESTRALVGIDALVQGLADGPECEPDPALIPIDFAGHEIPRLDPTRRLNPVGDVEELLDLSTRLFEKGGPLEDVERCLDGISRLCDQRPAHFDVLTEALGARIAEPSNQVGLVIAHAVGPWLGRVHLPALRTLGFLSRRAAEVGMRAERRHSATLLAFPTHASGFIEAGVLVERVAALSFLTRPDLTDGVAALLRVAPEGRREALAGAKRLRGELGAALRYALGGSERIGKTPDLWAAASRTRDPKREDPALESAFPNLGPDAAVPASLEVVIRRHRNEYRQEEIRLEVKSTPPVSREGPTSMATVFLHRPLSDPHDFFAYPYGIDARIVPLLAGIWPGHRESFYGCAVREMRWHASVSGARANPNFLAPLLDSDEPMGPMAVRALVLGLTAADGLSRVAAREVFVAAAMDGRLAGDELGDAFAELDRILSPRRVAETLSEAAREGPLVRAVIARALEGGLGGEAPKRPANWVSWLDLMLELFSLRGLAPRQPNTLAYLESIRGNGKAAKAARALLALEPGADLGERRGARAQALGERIERAQRWIARGGLPEPVPSS